MQEPETVMPAPKAAPASAKIGLTGPICASGGSRAPEGSGSQPPNTTA